MFGKDKKKRSRRVNTKYGQKTLKHARKGIQSCMMAVLCAGFLCFALLALAVYGFRLGLRGLNERDKKYITCKVGIGVNGLVLAGVAAIFIRGLV